MSGGGGGPGGHHEEEEHEEHVNHEAWVIPYADMLTLLMVMFVALFAVSNVDKEKFKELAQSARSAFGGESGQGVLSGGKSVLDGQGAGQLDGLTPASLARQQLADAALAEKEAGDFARAKEAAQMDGIEKKITTALPEEFKGAVAFRRDERGLVVTVVTDQVLFGSGSATIEPGGEGVLVEVANAIKAVPNQIAIEGHTDPSPIATAQFPSNWELSTARATSVLRFLVDRAGLDPTRLTASGYADTRPIADNASPDGKAKNRRVEIVVLNSLPTK